MPFPKCQQVSYENHTIYYDREEERGVQTLSYAEDAGINVRSTSLEGCEGIRNCAAGVVVEMRFYLVLVGATSR